MKDLKDCHTLVRPNMDVLTPSAVDRSYHLGLDFVKLFPGSLGGVSYMKALQGPFPNIPIMPTGGVKLEDMMVRFAAGAFAVGGHCSPKPGLKKFVF